MSPSPLSANEILQREFLEVRCKVLELAAALDRLDRAEGTLGDEVRIKRLREAMEILLEKRSDRAEQVQLTFSRPYDSHWQETLKLSNH